MKQTYKKPTTTLHNIRVQHLCTVSDPTQINMNSTDKAGKGTNVLSRRFNDWDDDYEE